MVMDSVTRVAIVLNPDAGEGLVQLAKVAQVWVVDTPANRAVAERIWSSEGDGDGLTTFRVDAQQPPETWLVDILPVVDDHCGLNADFSPEIEIDVQGVKLTAQVRDAFESFGPFTTEEDADGFRAVRRRES
jgi:hypothetical protein